jgi:4-aminobutyrate aminotransferase-like enzyme
VRGLGLMIGYEMDYNSVAAGSANAVSKECAKNGMLLLTAGAFEVLLIH